jgi:hypothetical protein
MALEETPRVDHLGHAWDRSGRGQSSKVARSGDESQARRPSPQPAAVNRHLLAVVVIVAALTLASVTASSYVLLLWAA